MSERALHVGGRLTVASDPGAGTEVRMDIPLPEVEE
jgi:signal transduction histidine kinase